MLKLKENSQELIDLSTIGGNHLFTLEELVEELVYNRKLRLLKHILKLQNGESNGSLLFDAIAFKAATDDFQQYLNNDSDYPYFEGSAEYIITAGNDCVWKCKTTIKWGVAECLAFGALGYHTDILETKGVNNINAMTGTLMRIQMINNSLSPLTPLEAYERVRQHFTQNR